MRVVFAWELGGGLGHLARLAPWIEALGARGATPLIAVRDLAALARAPWITGVEAVQAPFVPHGPLGADAQPVSYAGILLNAGYGNAGTLAALVRAWEALLRLSGAQALVADFAPTAILAARRSGLPVLHVGDGFTMPPADGVGGSFDLLGRAGATALRALDKRVTDTIEMVAPGLLENGSGVAGLVQADDIVLATFAELDHLRPCIRSADYAGHFEALSAGDAAPGWQDIPGPRVLAYLNPTARHFEALAALLAGMSAQTRLYASGLRRAATSRAGLGITWSEAPIPFATALPGADLVISHGGHGATCAALLAGRPLLLLPTVYEQVLTTRNVEALGAGLGLYPGGDAGRLRKLLTRCLDDPSLRAAAGAFAARHADNAASTTARLAKSADRLLALARDGRAA